MAEHPNQALLRRFYTAFGARDGEAMAACYTPDATFTDPVFVGLRDGEPGAMWRMLTGGSTDLVVELVAADVTDADGRARWIAHYTFGQTGRRVTNDVRSTFVFRDGLIAAQVDEFDFPRWAGQALGPTGRLLGRTTYLRHKVQRNARTGLDRYRAAEPR